MSHLAVWTAVLVGPVYLALVLGLYLGRRLCSEAQVLFELSEPTLMIAAIPLALAGAGLMVQLL